MTEQQRHRRGTASRTSTNGAAVTPLPHVPALGGSVFGSGGIHDAWSPYSSTGGPPTSPIARRGVKPRHRAVTATAAGTAAAGSLTARPPAGRNMRGVSPRRPLTDRGPRRAGRQSSTEQRPAPSSSRRQRATRIHYIPWTAPKATHEDTRKKGESGGVVCLVPMPRIAHVLHAGYMAPGKPRRPQYQGVINDEVVTSTEFGTGFPGGGIDVVEMMLENWLEEYRQEQWTFNSLGMCACAFSVYVVDVMRWLTLCLALLQPCMARSSSQRRCSSHRAWACRTISSPLLLAISWVRRAWMQVTNATPWLIP